MLNLDTHVLLAALMDSLRPGERALLESDEWAISGLVLWEIAKLSSLGRIKVRVDDSAFTELLRRVRILPLTIEVAMAHRRRLDFRSDPADEIIAATSIVHDAPLLTMDARLLQSGVVPRARRG